MVMTGPLTYYSHDVGDMANYYDGGSLGLKLPYLEL